MTDINQVHAVIKGRVQGVCFRACTREAARKMGITGWVKNLPGGDVEALFQGENSRIREMIAWCHQGSPASVVDEVQVRKTDPGPSHKTFDIRY